MSHTNADEIDCCMIFLRLLAEQPGEQDELISMGRNVEPHNKWAAGAMITSAGLAKLLSSGHRIIIVEPTETQNAEVGS